MELEITFPGGVVVETRVGGFTVRTDQPTGDGGENSAPSPYALFFASIGTCAGFYALRFCQARKIDTTELGVKMFVDRDAESGKVATIRIEVRLPPGFPEKYKGAIERAVDSCTVKRTILDPPKFEIAVR
jgi:ribosomal protein S12 methylthiotransferase accessory factor